MNLKHVCPYLGCHELIPISERYCNKHRSMANERQAKYDSSIRHKRDAKYTAFYHSQEWVKLQPIIIAKYHGLDLWAYYIDHKIVKANMVHHIIPIKDDFDKRIDASNLIPLSNTNHEFVEKILYKQQKPETQKKLFGLLDTWKKEFS